MARPRSDDARRVMVAFRATEEQVARWRAAAGEVTLSDFLRAAADTGADFATWDPAAPAVPIEDRADALRRGDLSALDASTTPPPAESEIEEIAVALRSGDHWRPVTLTEPAADRISCFRIVNGDRAFEFVGRLTREGVRKVDAADAFYMPIV